MFQSLFFWNWCLKFLCIDREHAESEVSILVFLELVFKDSGWVITLAYILQVSILVFLELVFKDTHPGEPAPMESGFQSLFFWNWCLKIGSAIISFADGFVSILVFLELVFKECRPRIAD